MSYQRKLFCTYKNKLTKQNLFSSTFISFVMSNDTSSVSSYDSLPDMKDVLNRQRSGVSGSRGNDASGERSFFIPLILGVILAAVLYCAYHYAIRCDSDNSNSNSNDNGIVVISRMSNSDGSGQVVDLTGDQLVAIWDQKPIVVAFMADGCGWCKKLSPEFHQAAAQGKQTLYSMHAHKENVMPILKKFGIQAFPTVVKIHKGNIVDEYKGNRTAQDLARWAAQ